MRLQLAILITGMMAMMMTAAASAHASLGPSDVIGKWGAKRGCSGGSDFAYVMQGNQVQQVVRDGEREFRTPVRIRIEGGYLRVQLDEKIYTFRLKSPDAMQALKYTDSRTGLTANFSPRTWFRCS